MKNAEKENKKVETKETPTKPTVSPDYKYPVSQLLDNCEVLTGYKKEVGEGALFETKEKELTKKEFHKKVNEFLKKEVK